MDVKTQIKNLYRIEDFIGNFVKLKKVGKNYKGLCPFHHEKTPSFVVSPEKQIFNCFGCGKGGDIFSFVQELDGVSFYEAVVSLGQPHGLSPKRKTERSPEETIRFQMYSANFNVSHIYQEALFQNAYARAFIKKRGGLKSSTIKDFGIGYASDWNTITPIAEMKKQVDIYLKAGLIKPKTTGKHRDTFGRRLIFPFYSETGKIVGFTGRTINNSKPKYLNTSETDVYHKRDIFYGLYQAKKYIRNLEYVVLVEGNFDVLSMYDFGIKNTIAVSGTAFTTNQAFILSRLTKRVVILFDGDTAGMKATIKTADILESVSIDTTAIFLPKGQDPDTYIREHGKDNVLSLIEKAKPVIIARTQAFLDAFNGNPGPEKVLQFSRKIILSLSTYSDRVKAAIHTKEVAVMLGLEPSAFKIPANNSKTKTNKILIPAHSAIKELAAMVLFSDDGDVVDRIVTEVLPYQFQEYHEVLDFIREGKDRESIINLINPDLRSGLISMKMGISSANIDVANFCINKIKLAELKDTYSKLKREIKTRPEVINSMVEVKKIIDGIEEEIYEIP